MAPFAGRAGPGGLHSPSPRSPLRPLIALAMPLWLAACAGGAPPRRQEPAGAARSAHLAEPGEVIAEHDLNHDGRPDTWTFTRRAADGRAVLVRRELDLNGDGKVDVWEAYGEDGALVKQTMDLDFDGKPDLVLHFEKGQLWRKEMGFGFDGQPHAWAYYEKGQLVRKERDENGDGRVDVWEYWEDGEVDRIGIDLDGDGRVDRWEQRKARAAGSRP